MAGRKLFDDDGSLAEGDGVGEARAPVVGGEAEAAAHEVDVLQIERATFVAQARSDERHVAPADSVEGLRRAFDGQILDADVVREGARGGWQQDFRRVGHDRRVEVFPAERRGSSP